MGLHRAPFMPAACDLGCCEPGTATKAVETLTTPLSTASSYAFVLAVRERKLPRDVLQRIVSLAVVEERRVITRHQIAPSRREKNRMPALGDDPFGGGFGGLCLEADDDDIP